DGKITVNGKDGESVTIKGKNGEIGIQGPKGNDGKSNSVTISGKDGTIGTTGKDGSSVVLNGKDGSIGIKGKDGKNKVDITTGDSKVGLDGNDGETRIIVKDGNQNNELATMNDGLKFMGDSGTVTGVKLNNQVNIVGGVAAEKDGNKVTNLTDNNIGVESMVDNENGKNAKLVVRLAKNLSDLESITFNSQDKTTPMKIDGNAKTIENIKKMTFGKDGSTDSVTVDGENKVITGLSNTKLPTDLTKMKADQAASQGQLKQVLDKANDTDKFAVKYDKNTDGSVNKNSITLGGDTNGTVIKNVKAGDLSKDSKEAVNGSQLYKTNQGFDILVGQDTADNRANVALGQDKKETVEFAAGNSLDVTLDKDNKKVIYSLKDDIEVGKEGQPGQAGKDGKVTVNGKDGEKVTIDGKDGKIESKAKDGTTVTVNGKDGTVGAKGTDGTSVTMNGKDGTIGGKGADGTTVTMNAKDGTIGAQGPKGANGKDGASVTINGKDGITTITGATDDKDHKNVIALDGKDGKMGVTGKDGNSVTLNGQDGSIDMKGKDGTNKVQITTKDGKVGVDGNDGDTRLVVKEGTKTHELATMNDGMQFAGDIGAENKLKLNQKLTVTGGITDNAKLSQDNNIGVIADGTSTLTLRLAKAIKGLDSITFGADDTAMKIDGNAKTIENIKKMTFGKDGSTDSVTVDGEQKVITGLSNTTLPKDMTTMKADQAASQGQLKEVLDNAVKYDKKTDGTVDTSSITLEGGNDGTVIKNVKAGDVSENSKEAVNGSQLYKTNQGFDILVGEDTEANRANVALGQDKKETVKFDAGKNLSASLDKASKKVSYRLNDEIELGEAKTADKPGVNGKITIHGTTGEKMTMDGKNGEVIIETTDENGKKNEVFLKSHDGTMGVIGKENNGVTLHGEGFVRIKGAGSDKAIDLTTEKGQVGVDGQGSSTRLLMKEGNIPHALATMDDGLKFMGDSGTTVGVKLNNQINIVGGVKAEKEDDVVKNLTDNNIGVESIVDDQNGKNAKMKIRLAKKLSDMESITFNSQDKTNPMTIDGVGRTIKDLTTMTFLKDGKNNFITGLSNVTWPAKEQRGTDFDVSKAATQGQIQDVENAVDEKFKKSNAGFDVYIKEKTNENTFNIALGKDEKEAFGFLAGNGLEITRNGKEITYAMKDDITLGKKNSAGQDDGKDGKFTVTGKAGNSVAVDGKDGQLTLASATDDKGKKNQIALNGKDGSVRGDGKSGNAFEMNADAGTVGAKGADGSAVVLNGKDGTIDMNGKDGKNKVTIGTQEGKVGIDGTNGTTRVVVKDGDKVNELATMNDGLKFKGDSGDVVNRKLNETLTIEGGADTTKLSDKNIGVVTDAANGKMSVKLAKDLKDLTSVETKDDQGNTTNMTGAGVTTKDDKGNITATTATGMTNTDAAGHVTNTTASGVVAKDKDKNETSLTATGTVVKDKDEHETSTTATGVVTKDKDGNKTTVSATGVTTEDKDKNTNVSTAKDITVADKDGNKTVINKDGMTITHAGQDVISLTKDGLNNGGKTITGVATGVNDTDAVNVKQLKDEIEKNRTRLEGSDNIAVSGSGKADDPFKVSLKDDITLGKKNSAGQDDGKDGKFTVTGKDGNSVAVDGKDGQLTLASATDDKGKKNQIALNGKDGSVRGDGKSGNAFEMNADAGTVGAKGADGSAVVLNGKDGTIDMNGKDGKNKVTIGTQEGKVGIDGTNGTTRVVVKEGDKVNELATMNDGLKFKGDSGDVVNRKLNETLSIEGGADTTKLSDKNIGVVTDAANGKMSVKLAKDLKDLTSVETKDDQGNTTNMTGAGTTTTDNKGNTTTTNATGVTTTDGKGNTTTTTVDGVTTTDGKGNTTVINKGGITIQAKDKKAVSLTDKGLDNGGNKLTSITDGDISKDSKDAVNGGQLYKTNQGFDILVGEDTPKNRANVALGKDKKETVEFAAGNGLIATIDKDTKKITYAMKDTIEIGKKGEKDGKLVVNGKDGESITMNGKDGIVETKGKDGTTVTMNGKDGTVGAKGTDGTTVTMNGKDGIIGGKGADGTTVIMNAKDGTIGAKGADGKDGASVTINGKDGTTTINGATDKDGKKNTISLDGKNGKMGVTGKDGNSVTLNGQDGSIGMKGKDGKNTVQITTKDGKVGVDGKDGETRIVVKDGDKVNELATMNDGMKFAGDSGDVVNRKLNETLSIEGGVKDATKLSDGNIGVVTDKANGKMTVKLAKELKNLERVETKTLKADTIETKSMKMGDVTLNETGLTIKNGPAVTKAGIDAGGKAIHHVAPGVIAANSQDAVNGAQLFGTEMRVTLLGAHINRVGAGASALAGLHPLDFDPDDKWDFSAAYGSYSGNGAFALGAYYRPSESSMVSVGGTLGNDNNMFNIGVSLKMGRGNNNITNSRIAMAKEILDLRKENKALKTRLDGMEEKMNQVLTKVGAPKESLYTPAMYPDVPENHWVYHYIKTLQAKELLGAFQDMANKKQFTRHEIAQLLYTALKKGAAVDDTMDRALSEFENEIREVRDVRIRVDRLRSDVQGDMINRVRVNDVPDTKQSQVNS
ncbi:YadA-like family protein, partial [uncultured Megasphaera sp.]|uniref:YadA-like family protein n=1 Tax=uncultured Megasphaera sp. TaxID=165188 RepID=UPI002597F94E